MKTRDYDSTVARIAGNILSHVKLREFVDDESGGRMDEIDQIEMRRLSGLAVMLAREVVAETKRTEPINYMPDGYPTPDKELEGHDELIERLTGNIRGAFATTGGTKPVFVGPVSVDAVIRFILLRTPHFLEIETKRTELSAIPIPIPIQYEGVSTDVHVWVLEVEQPGGYWEVQGHGMSRKAVQLYADRCSPSPVRWTGDAYSEGYTAGGPGGERLRIRPVVVMAD